MLRMQGSRGFNWTRTIRQNHPPTACDQFPENVNGDELKIWEMFFHESIHSGDPFISRCVTAKANENDVSTRTIMRFRHCHLRNKTQLIHVVHDLLHVVLQMKSSRLAHTFALYLIGSSRDCTNCSHILQNWLRNSTLQRHKIDANVFCANSPSV